MANTIFAAINVGSYELSMKIFEISYGKGLRELDHIRHRLDLGTDSYGTGKIQQEHIDELCRILKEFKMIMDSYKAGDYKAYGTSAIREIDNRMIVLEQIKNRTGMEVEILSNSEQRFLDYKSIASKGEAFNRIIEKSTAIVDIGGGSTQVSLFDKDSLVTTQNMRLGILRMKEQLNHLKVKPAQMEGLVEEMVNNRLAEFKKLHLKDRNVNNIIIVDDYVSMLLPKRIGSEELPGCVDKDSYLGFVEKMKSKTASEISKIFDIPEENMSLVYLSAIFIKRFLQVMEADTLWAPGVTLCDGIAFEYAERNKLLPIQHNFEQDILACARNISKRYMGTKWREELLEKISLTLFDAVKKPHNLGKRERLLLQIAALLHDCGKYISLVNVGECSYNIVMATEIIGLSHKEREMVANIVRYNQEAFQYFDEMGRVSTLDKESYLVIAKLTAIMRVAHSLTRSHKQKYKDVKTVIKDDVLSIVVDTNDEITMEKGGFARRAMFFEEVFSLKLSLRKKK